MVYQLENLADQVSDFVDHMMHPEIRGDARMQADAVIADARSKAQRIQDEMDALLGEARKHSSDQPSVN